MSNYYLPTMRVGLSKGDGIESILRWYNQHHCMEEDPPYHFTFDRIIASSHQTSMSKGFLATVGVIGDNNLRGGYQIAHEVSGPDEEIFLQLRHAAKNGYPVILTVDQTGSILAVTQAVG